jgi:hypothetical protein
MLIQVGHLSLQNLRIMYLPNSAFDKHIALKYIPSITLSMASAIICAGLDPDPVPSLSGPPDDPWPEQQPVLTRRGGTAAASVIAGWIAGLTVSGSELLAATLTGVYSSTGMNVILKAIDIHRHRKGRFV